MCRVTRAMRLPLNTVWFRRRGARNAVLNGAAAAAARRRGRARRRGGGGSFCRHQGYYRVDFWVAIQWLMMICACILLSTQSEFHSIYNRIVNFSFVAFCSFFFPGSLSIFYKARQLKSGNRQLKSSVVLDKSTVFHRGRQQKSSRARQQNSFFKFWPHFSIR